MVSSETCIHVKAVNSGDEENLRDVLHLLNVISLFLLNVIPTNTEKKTPFHLENAWQ